jgi:hypothetical protein
MAELGLAGVVRGKVRRATISDSRAPEPHDLVNRNSRPLALDRLWVAGFTCVPPWPGWCCTALVIDACARRILGWPVATTMTSQLVVDAVDQAVWTRHREGKNLTGLAAHHDHGVQYLSVACVGHLDAAGIKPSAGAVGSISRCGCTAPGLIMFPGYHSSTWANISPTTSPRWSGFPAAGTASADVSAADVQSTLTDDRPALVIRDRFRCTPAAVPGTQRRGRHRREWRLSSRGACTGRGSGQGPRGTTSATTAAVRTRETLTPPPHHYAHVIVATWPGRRRHLDVKFTAAVSCTLLQDRLRLFRGSPPGCAARVSTRGSASRHRSQP